jgi:hypothetical protein
MFAILLAYAVAGSMGFGMQNRSQLAGSQETRNAQLTDQIADRDQATMPAEAQKLFNEIMQKVEENAVGGENDYPTIALDDEEAGRLGEAVLSLHTELNDGI